MVYERMSYILTTASTQLNIEQMIKLPENPASVVPRWSFQYSEGSGVVYEA